MLRPLRVDPFICALLVILVAGILIPLPAAVTVGLAWVGQAAVVVLFFVYGARLSTREVVAGLANLRLQLGVLAATFVIFPLIGYAARPLLQLALGPLFALGTVYLTLLPSTVQSSVGFTSIARGNVAGAVCSATISNILGVIVTPMLVLLVMGRASGVEVGRILNVIVQILLPFAIGQLLQPRIGAWLRGHGWVTRAVDQGTIMLVVAGAVAGATARHLWDGVTWLQVVALVVSSGVILAIMLCVTWFGSRGLGLAMPERIVMLMCGSKKSLATGLPMATIIFPAATVAAVTVPVIVFHQLQLVVCAVLARRLARR